MEGGVLVDNKGLAPANVNALAETVNGYYKTELIRGPQQDPWKTVEDVELATLGWVHWHNTARLHGHCNDVPPAEFEAAFYAAQHPDQLVESNNQNLYRSQWDSIWSLVGERRVHTNH